MKWIKTKPYFVTFGELKKGTVFQLFNKNVYNKDIVYIKTESTPGVVGHINAVDIQNGVIYSFRTTEPVLPYYNANFKLDN